MSHPPFGVLDREGVKHVLRRAYEAYHAYDADPSDEAYQRAVDAGDAYRRAVENYTSHRTLTAAPEPPPTGTPRRPVDLVVDDRGRLLNSAQDTIPTAPPAYAERPAPAPAARNLFDEEPISPAARLRSGWGPTLGDALRRMAPPPAAAPTFGVPSETPLGAEGFQAMELAAPEARPPSGPRRLPTITERRREAAGEGRRLRLGAPNAGLEVTEGGHIAPQTGLRVPTARDRTLADELLRYSDTVMPEGAAARIDRMRAAEAPRVGGARTAAEVFQAHGEPAPLQRLRTGGKSREQLEEETLNRMDPNFPGTVLVEGHRYLNTKTGRWTEVPPITGADVLGYAQRAGVGVREALYAIPAVALGAVVRAGLRVASLAEVSAFPELAAWLQRVANATRWGSRAAGAVEETAASAAQLAGYGVGRETLEQGPGLPAVKAGATYALAAPAFGVVPGAIRAPQIGRSRALVPTRPGAAGGGAAGIDIPTAGVRSVAPGPDISVAGVGAKPPSTVPSMIETWSGGWRAADLNPRTATAADVDAIYRRYVAERAPLRLRDPRVAGQLEQAGRWRQAWLDQIAERDLGRIPEGGFAPEPVAALPAAGRPEPEPARPAPEVPVRDVAAVEADIRTALAARDYAAVGNDAAGLAAAQQEIDALAAERASLQLGGAAAPPVAEAPGAERPGRALHDAEGRPIPGTEIQPRLAPGEVERRAAPAGAPIPGGVERRAPVESPVPAPEAVAPPAPSAPRPEPVTPTAAAPFAPSPQFPPVAGAFDVPLSAMNYDPDTYQFKQIGAGAQGQSLADVEKWDKNREGITLLWRNPATGTNDIANGHNRYQAALRLGIPSLPSRFIDAASPKEARAIGALANIAENRGDALDVAKVFRDMRITPETLRAEGISLREGLVESGLSLARLAPDLFERTARGEIPQREAIAVGSILDDAAMQRAALAAVQGRGKSEANVREVARQVRDAGTEDVSQETLFGAEMERRSLFVERADIAVAIKKKLSRDRFMAKYLSGEGRAAEIEARGLGAVNPEAAQAQAEEGGRLGETFTRLYTRSGPLADVVTECARRLEHGEKSAAVVADIYPAIRDAIARELDAGAAGPARVQEVAGLGAAEAAGPQDLPEGVVPDSTDIAQSGLFEPPAPPYGARTLPSDPQVELGLLSDAELRRMRQAVEWVDDPKQTKGLSAEQVMAFRADRAALEQELERRVAEPSPGREPPAARGPEGLPEASAARVAAEGRLDDVTARRLGFTGAQADEVNRLLKSLLEPRGGAITPEVEARYRAAYANMPEGSRITVREGPFAGESGEVVGSEGVPSPTGLRVRLDRTGEIQFIHPLRAQPESPKGVAEPQVPYDATPTLTLEKGRPRDLGEALIQEFGETEIAENAGYLLSDGRMVDFSEGGGEGRSADHRAAERLFDYRIGGKLIDPQTVRGGRWKSVQKVMDDGHARLHVSQDLVMVDIGQDLTPAQVRVVRRIVGQGRGRRDLILEFTKDGDSLAHVERHGAMVGDVDEAVMDLASQTNRIRDVRAKYGGESVRQGNLFGAEEVAKEPVQLRRGAEQKDIFPETESAKARVQRKLKPEEVEGRRLGLKVGETEPPDLPGERPMRLLEEGVPYGPKRPPLPERTAEDEVAALRAEGNEKAAAALERFMEGSQARRVAFRGDYRADKLGARFLKARVTSGRFYFTEDPEIAGKYAENKPYIPEEGMGFEQYFKIGKGREARDLDHAWYSLTSEQRSKFLDALSRAHLDEETSAMLFGEAGDAIASPDHIAYELQAARGDGLKAAKEIWLNSGAIFGEEEKFGALLKRAGIPYAFDDPREGVPGVTPAWLSIRRPIDAAAPPADWLAALRQAAKTDRTRAKPGMTLWDKDSRTFREWLQTLEEDKGRALWATSMPEKAVKIAQRLGYDGVLDTGGKLSGETHRVWVAFEPNQIKSAIGNRGTFGPGSSIVREVGPLYHGSPYRFERFDISKVGTGQGAQSFGYGLYFAQRPGVAKSYREQLTGRIPGAPTGRSHYSVKGQTPPGGQSGHEALDTAIEIDQYLGALTYRGDDDFAKTVKRNLEARAARFHERDAKGWITGSAGEDWRAQVSFYEQYVRDAVPADVEDLPRGALYEVKVDGEVEEFLSLDEPLSAQPPKVKAALRKLGFDPDVAPKYPTLTQAKRLFTSPRVDMDSYSDIGIRETLREGYKLVEAGNQAGFRRWFNEHGRLLSPGRVPEGHMLGEDAYEKLTYRVGYYTDAQMATLRAAGKLPDPTPPAEKASRALRQAGVRGLRYRDQQSRDLPEGQEPTYNYVVFDDQDIKITAVREAAAHLDLVFGSPKAAEQAARLGLQANRVPTMDERGKAMPTGAQTYVEVRGKRVSNAEDTALVIRPFRSPFTETFGVLLQRGEEALSVKGLLSGVIDHVQIPMELVDGEWLPMELCRAIAAEVKSTGATTVKPFHNHPSGRTKPSGGPGNPPGDIEMTELIGKGLRSLGVDVEVEHTIINHDTVSVIRLVNGKAVVEEDIPVTPPAGEPTPDWTQVRGPELLDPGAVASVVGHISDHEMLVVYRDNSGRAAAMAPHRKSAREDIGTWLPGEMRSIGATGAIIVTPGTDRGLWLDLATDRRVHELGVLDVIGLDARSGVYDSAAGRGLIHEKAPSWAQAFEARRAVAEERAPYGPGEGAVPAGRGAGEPVPESGAGPGRPPEEGTVSLKKAEAAAIRERLGLAELPPPEGQSFQEAWDQALAEGLADKVAGLARAGTNRPLSPVEHAAAVQRYITLERELLRSRKALAEAAQANQQAIVDLEVGRSAAVLEEINQLTQLTDRTGTAAGRALSVRRLSANIETFTLARGLQEARAKKGSGLTPEEVQRIEAATQRVAELDAENARLRAENERLAAEREQALAQAVAAVARKATLKGRQSITAIQASRAATLKKLEALGLRLNDITGVSLEGLYLIGELAVSHVREQVALGVEKVALDAIVEKVLAELNNPAIDARDIYRALSTKHPTRVRRDRQGAEQQVRNLKTQARLLVEIEKAEQGLFAPRTRPRAEVPPEIAVLRTRLTRLRTLAYQTATDDARLARALRTIDELQDQLANHRRALKQAKRPDPEALADLKTRIAGLRKQMRVEDALADIEEQLRTGHFKVPPRPEPTRVSPELERNQIALAQARRRWRAAVENMGPVTVRKVIGETTGFLRTMKATADMSGTLRQGALLSARRPVTAASAFGRSLKSFFSAYTAEQIDNAIRQSPLQLVRDRAKLFLAELEGPLSQHEEWFASRLAQRIPVIGSLVRASERSMVTTLNLLRTAAFDEFVARNPNATDAELKAWANWVNVASGRGDLGKAGAVANELAVVVFAPRFAMSRIQAPFMMFKHWKEPRVRREIAKDYAAALALGIIALTLAHLAGFEVGIDPRSPDFGKIRIGDTRIDIWAGVQQPIRLLLRVVLGATDRAGLTGEGLTRQDVAFDPLEALGRFAAFKVSPIVSVPLELYRGASVVGEPRTAAETMARSVLPLMWEDVADAYGTQGPGRAALVGGLTFLGVGVTTYTDSETETRRKLRRLVAAGRSEAARERLHAWNLAHPDKLIRSLPQPAGEDRKVPPSTGRQRSLRRRRVTRRAPR